MIETKKASDYIAKGGYLTAPVKSTGMPTSVPFIIGNEAAERFSFYGMKAILVVFMTKYLVDASGQLAPMADHEAKYWFHLFVSAVYFLPLLGAVIADAFLGKYRTIILLSIVYCLGHLALALDDTRVGLFVGLALISLGAGGIKPCVSANVGDQFGPSNAHLMPRVFSWFYFSINFGSLFSTLLIPFVLQKKGPHWAFAIPGILMLLATVIFWLGRKKFVHIRPTGMEFVRESFSPDSLKIIGRLFIIYAFVAMFWTLFDQTSSSWVLQSEKMNLHWLGTDWLPSQLQAMNPLLILIFIPLFSYAVYPALNRIFPLTPLRKISIGLFVAVLSFLVSAWIEAQIGKGLRPSVGWLFVAYMFVTAAEVMVSITCLEFSYTQAPKRMKSLIMGFYLSSVTLGNLFTAAVNKFIQNTDGTSMLPGASYYLFFAGLMLATAVLFIPVAYFYKVQNFIQDEMSEPAA